MDSENPRETVKQVKYLSPLRMIFGSIGILVMVFSGGCSLFVLGNYFQYGRDSYGFNDPSVVAVIGGVPFVVGLLVWWLAAKYKRVQIGDSNER